jgi:hypothetical protein
MKRELTSGKKGLMESSYFQEGKKTFSQLQDLVHSHRIAQLISWREAKPSDLTLSPSRGKP